ncbi:hypothetical protein [Nitrosomonas sp. Nm51]|uniref:hypothetical protein n=1 Tax=Nitrosomonas sp. Nm51 TaxID=133720 RepID=UPI001C4346C6|nr:hypothetical protein [Nitrosomonas sp. Nm51]
MGMLFNSSILSFFKNVTLGIKDKIKPISYLADDELNALHHTDWQVSGVEIMV